LTRYRRGAQAATPDVWAALGEAALRKWGAIVGAGLALSSAAPANAAVVVFQDTFAFDQSGFKSVFLPKWGGPNPITGVSLQFVGETNKFLDVFAGDEPAILPETPVSWTVALQGPAVEDGGVITFEELGSFVVNTAYPEIELPGNPGEQVTRITPVIPFTIDAVDTRLDLYKGLGENEFEIVWDPDPFTQTRGTLKLFIEIAPIPEPGTWSLMILGFGATGAALRRRRALAA
jgi:hypothetical protein